MPEVEPQAQTTEADSAAERLRLPTDEQQLLRLRRLGALVADRVGSGYRGQDRAFYVVSSLSDDDVDSNPNDDYVMKDANGDLGPELLSAPIVTTLACIQAAGSTSYSLAIDEAAHELAAHGRPDVQDVIVFFTDGGANTTHDIAGDSWPAATRRGRPPCGSGVEAAKRVPGDTAIYSIGYDLENQTRRRSAASGRARAATRTTASRPESRRPGATPRRRRSWRWRRCRRTSTTPPTRRAPAALPAGRGRRPDQRVASRRQRPPRPPG